MERVRGREHLSGDIQRDAEVWNDLAPVGPAQQLVQPDARRLVRQDRKAVRCGIALDADDGNELRRLDRRKATDAASNRRLVRRELAAQQEPLPDVAGFVIENEIALAEAVTKPG